MANRPAPSHAKDTMWSIVNEGAALVGATASFTLLGVELGPSSYGAFIGLIAVMGPFLAFSNSGVFLAVLDGLQRSKRSGVEVVRSCVGLASVIGVLGSIVASTVVLLFIDGISVWTAILMCGGELVFGSVSNVLLGAIQVERGFAASARIRIAYHCLRVMMLVGLWQTDLLQLLPYSIAHTSVVLVLFVVSSRVVNGHFQQTVLWHRGRREDLRTVSTYAFGLSALSVQNDGDKFALNNAGFQSEAGQYGFAYRVVQLGLLPVHSLLTATHVSFLDPSAKVRSLDRSIGLAKIASGYLLAVTGILWFVAPVVPRILGEDYGDTGMIIRWLLPLLFFRGVGGFAMNGLLGLGLNHWRTRLLIVGAIFSVVLYATLIPRFSWRGAAVATTVSEIALFAMAWIALAVAQRRADRSESTDDHPVEGGATVLESLDGGETS